MDNVLEIGMGNYILWETEVLILKEKKKKGDCTLSQVLKTLEWSNFGLPVCSNSTKMPPSISVNNKK